MTLARAGNPGLIAQREAVRAAEADMRSSRSTYLPDLTGSVSQSRMHGGSTKDDYSYGLSVSQRIYPGLTEQPEVARARWNLESARADLMQTSASIHRDLKSAYSRLIYAQQYLTLTEQIAARREQNVSLVKARFDAGREHQGSYLRAKAQHDQAKYDFHQAERARRVAQRELLKAIGQDTFADLRAAGPFPAPDADTGVQIAELAGQVPAVLKARADEAAARSGLDVTRQSFKPTVTASASGDRNGGNWPPKSNSGDWTGKVSMSIPLFKGGDEVHDVRSAERTAAKSAQQRVDAEQQATLDIETSWAAMHDAIENVGVRRAFLQAAELRAEIAQAQYTSGLLSFDDWDIIENDLIAQRKSALAAGRDAALAGADWEQTIGRGFAE